MSVATSQATYGAAALRVERSVVAGSGDRSAGRAAGIVQEFQFGINWAGYSRSVGSVFGAPLAIEALAAFFIESTFLGIWIFGYKRISEGWHLATSWLAA